MEDVKTEEPVEAKPQPRPATEEDTGCSEKERFEMELEFVQVRPPRAPRRHAPLQQRHSVHVAPQLRVPQLCTQALANPNYLNWLAQNRYFEDVAFLHYLAYLRYFERSEYAKYIKCALLYFSMYPSCTRDQTRTPRSCMRSVCQAAAEPQPLRFPHCLHFLELVQQPEFRARVARQDFATAVSWQQFYFWLHYRKNRVRDALAEAGEQEVSAEGGAEAPMDTAP